MKKINISLALSLFLGTTLANAQNENSDYVVTIKTNSEVIDTAGSFSVIKQDEIKKLNANSVQKILENTPGINLSANDRSINGRKNITFRGMDPRHTAILIDGNKISNTDAHIGHSDFQFSWIPMEQIEKIEVIRGPMSSLYGSKALGGVVNIITKKPKTEFHADLGLKYSYPESGHGVRKDISFNASKKFEKFYFNFGVEKSLQGEVLDKRHQNRDTLFEGAYIANLNLKLGYEIDENQDISFSMLRGKEQREATLDYGLGGKPVHYDKYYDIDKKMYNLQYDRATHFGGFNLKGLLTQSDSHTDQFQKTHKLEDKVLSSELYVDILENHYLIFGAEFKKEYYGSIYDSVTFSPIPGIKMPSTNFSGDTTNKSLYLQDEINLGEKFLLTIGGRYDYHSIFSSEFSPKAYLVYKVAQNHRLKAGYGRGFNAPTLKEMSQEYMLENPNAGHAFRGNPELKPEIVNTYELAYEYFDNTNSFKLSAFYNDIEDLISTTQTGEKSPLGMDLEKYDNIKAATTRGFELEFSRQGLWLENLAFNASYTFLDTKDQETKRELSFRPKHKVNINLDYSINKNISTSLRYAYTGEQKNYRIIENEMDILDGFSTLAFQTSYSINKNFNIRAGIDNITNEKLDEMYNYQLRDRTFYIGLNYKW